MKIVVTPGKVRQMLESVGQIVLPDRILAESLTEDQIKAVAGLFPKWRVGETVKPGDLRHYQGDLYECIQGHTTQADWTPGVTPALWKIRSAPGVIPEWVQPTGAHDAYDIGDKVTHNGKVWQSTINGNTTVPGENLEHNYWIPI